MEGNNRIRAEGIKPFRTLLQNNLVLTFLNVSGNNIGKEGLNHILAGLKYNKTLLSLKLSKNSLSGESMIELFKVIKDTGISELDISRNPIGNLKAAEYTEELKCWEQLKTLNISDWSLSNVGMDSFFKNLSLQNMYLNVLIADKVSVHVLIPSRTTLKGPDHKNSQGLYRKSLIITVKHVKIPQKDQSFWLKSWTWWNNLFL